MQEVSLLLLHDVELGMGLSFPLGAQPGLQDHGVERKEFLKNLLIFRRTVAI